MAQVAALLNQYNSTEQQLSAVQGSETAMVAMDSQVAIASSDVNQRQGQLNKLQQDDAYLIKRIHRNENPRFLHWFVCDRIAKVERLKEEQDELVARETDLSAKLAPISAGLLQLQQKQQQAHAVVDEKHRMESTLRGLFDQVIECQPPTQTLQQLRANAQQQQQILMYENSLSQAVGSSAQQVQQGLSFFQQAEGLYRQAANMNQGAQQTVSAEVSEARQERRARDFGDDIGAEDAEWQRENLERQERMFQAQRDSLVNQGNEVAMRAYQAISTAFSSFPMEGRSRYPQLCAGIGQVAFPCVQGADFTDAIMADAIFGTMGAAMNDFSSGCKIQNNMRVVEQCMSMSSQQLGLITAMQRAVQANVQQFQVNAQDMERNISNERMNIFNAARAAFGGS